jgi:hypothetical protein
MIDEALFGIIQIPPGGYLLYCTVPMFSCEEVYLSS